jgi:hypothetical protein
VVQAVVALLGLHHLPQVHSSILLFQGWGRLDLEMYPLQTLHRDLMVERQEMLLRLRQLQPEVVVEVAVRVQLEWTMLALRWITLVVLA